MQTIIIRIFLFISYFNYLSAQPLKDYLGMGMNEISMRYSSANIYQPTPNNIFQVDLPQSQLVEFSVIMQERFDIEAYFYEKIESSDFFGFGSNSQEIYRFYENHYVGNKSLTKIILTLAYKKYTAPVLPFPTDQLSKAFLLSISELPLYNPNNQTSRQLYTEFIDAWGTSVIDEIVTGGYFESNLWYDIEFNNIYSEDRISESSHWSFAGIIGSGHGSTSDNYFVDKEFNATISMEYLYVGGNVNMNANQYLDWAASVQEKQQIIKYHTVPIVYFIQDPIMKTNLANAIHDYGKDAINRLTCYINDLQTKKH